MVALEGGNVGGKGIIREFGLDMYTLLYLKWITNKHLLNSIANSAPCYVATWIGRGFGENGYMYMYGWVLSLFTWNYHNTVNQPSVSSVQFSCSAVSDSLRPHESQHARPPCPSPTPGVHSDSCPSSQLCHPAISSSVIPFSSCPQSLPASQSSNKATLPMRWPKYWSFRFSIIPSKEHPGLISFRMDWFDLLAVLIKCKING